MLIGVACSSIRCTVLAALSTGTSIDSSLIKMWQNAQQPVYSFQSLLRQNFFANSSSIDCSGHHQY